MIIPKYNRNNLEQVKALSLPVYEFLSQLEFGYPEDGQLKLEDGITVSIMTYQTRKATSGNYEAHRKFIDLQYILSGKEVIVVDTLENMRHGQCLKAYDDTADFELYEAKSPGTSYLLEEGDFLMLYPENPHMPGLAHRLPAEVRKIVIKIPVEHARQIM